MLCPRHHRALHMGEFRIEGDPEAGTVRFLDRFDRPVQPPDLDPTGSAPPSGGVPPGSSAARGTRPGTVPPSDTPSETPPDTDPSRDSAGCAPLRSGPPSTDAADTGSHIVAPRDDDHSAFTPPVAERLSANSFTWN